MADVLLIEDNPGDARLIQEMAAATTFQVAPCLEEGVEALRDGTFDAVLLDLALPDSGGLESLTTLRVFDSQTPIIVLTGLDDEGVALEAMAVGAHAYLIKGRTDAEALAVALATAQDRLRFEQDLGAGAPGAATVCVLPSGPGFLARVTEHLATVPQEAVLYIAMDRSATLVRDRLQGAGKRLHFIDSTFTPGAAAPDLHPMDDPTDLDALVLEVERACAALGRDARVVLDSVPALLLHHDLEAATRFCHFLANRVRVLGVDLDLLALDNSEWPFLRDRLAFLDHIVGPSVGIDPAVA